MPETASAKFRGVWAKASIHSDSQGFSLNAAALLDDSGGARAIQYAITSENCNTLAIDIAANPYAAYRAFTT